LQVIEVDQVPPFADCGLERDQIRALVAAEAGDHLSKLPSLLVGVNRLDRHMNVDAGRPRCLGITLQTELGQFVAHQQGDLDTLVIIARSRRIDVEGQDVGFVTSGYSDNQGFWEMQAMFASQRRRQVVR
jgi:hypothetical protein